MWNKLTSLINQYLIALLNIINFQGATYVNLWSLSLLMLSIYVCVKTKEIPAPVAMIFSSIIIAYGAHKATQNLSGKGQDNDNGNAN